LKQKNPNHIAIVMDGNGRWASQKGLPRIEGHQQGVRVVKEVVKHCLRHEIPYLSLYTFSHENWLRPQEEVEFLMELFLSALQNEIEELSANGVRLRFLGSRDRLSPQLLAQMDAAEQQTLAVQKLNLNIALNYTGKWDIVNAVQTLAKKVANQELKPEDIQDVDFEQGLATHDIPDPDLFIRTSGEQRISNFFLWQLAYTELYFTDVFWPDFNEKSFEEALAFFHSRERRFGMTSQQLRDNQHV
jgi:undecaprenyl diphosphate synthase